MSEKDSLMGRDPPSERCFRIFQPFMAEFVGTLLFVFIATMCMQDPRTLTVACSHGFAIVLLMMCFQHISGAHLNPAVTLSTVLGGGVRVFMAPLYVVAQLLGGLVGAACTRAILGTMMAKGEGDKMISQFTSQDGGAEMLEDNVSPGIAVTADMMATFLVCLAFLMSSVDSIGKNYRLAPIGVGFAYINGILINMQITGPSMNPARSLGACVAISYYEPKVWTNHWVYWVGPCLGALLAAILFRFIFASPDHRIPRREKIHN